MFSEYTFIFPLQAGLHARPAGALAEIAAAFAADIQLVNERTGTAVDAKSMLSMIGVDIRKGDVCRLRLTGADQATACRVLREFVDIVLPSSDEPLPTEISPSGTATLPRGLKSDTPFVPGTVIHNGIGQGCVVFLDRLSLPETVPPSATRDPEQEEEVFRKAAADLRSQMEHQLAGYTGSAAGILKAHLLVMSDPAFLNRVQEGIQQNVSAGQSVLDAGRFFIDRLAAGSGYIRERAVDIQEVCLQLLQNLYESNFSSPVVHLTQPSIVVVDHLGPRQLLDLDRNLLQGLAVGEMSDTSHAAILAKAFDVPTLSGVTRAGLRAGQTAIIDAQQGILIPSPDDAAIRYYQKEIAARSCRAEKLALNARAPAVTADGVRLEVAANTSTAEEVERAMALGAEGIGLFRTEMLYLSRDSAPTEEIQISIYQKALLHADGRPVIIRTLDIGGDKPVPYLNLPEENNPFLGYRGVRIYRDHLALFETQLRAVIRASVEGTIRLMIPMVSSVEEIRWVKERIATIHETFKAEGVSFDPDMEIGVMIETPAAVFLIQTLSGEVDFFSIGTNDLSQYFFAADRDNSRVSGLCSVRHPAFLRILSQAVTGAHANGKWIGLCGEMAQDPANLPLLVGMGLNEISTGSAAIPRLKRTLAALSAERCREAFEKSMSCSTVAEVDDLLEQVISSSDQRLLDAELIVLDSVSATKEEAIRELANALYISGRTDHPSAVEEAVWAREAVGGTGVGFGFGVPHCKSDAMNCHSIGIARFKNPVAWNSQEDEPVRMIILLALLQFNSGTLHMKIFSKLARKLMHSDFRQQLLESATEKDLVLFLEQELGLLSYGS